MVKKKDSRTLAALEVIVAASKGCPDAWMDLRIGDVARAHGIAPQTLSGAMKQAGIRKIRPGRGGSAEWHEVGRIVEEFRQAVDEVQLGEWMAESSVWLSELPSRSWSSYCDRHAPGLWAAYRARRKAYRQWQADEIVRLVREGKTKKDAAEEVGQDFEFAKLACDAAGVGKTRAPIDWRQVRLACIEATAAGPLPLVQLAEAVQTPYRAIYQAWKRGTIDWLVDCGQVPGAGHRVRLWRARPLRRRKPA
jgi:transposase-like protein